MATNKKRTNINTALSLAGLSDLTVAMNRGQLESLINIVRAGNGDISLAAQDQHDIWVIADAGSQANTITIKSVPVGHSVTSGVKTVEIAVNGSDALSVTYTSGAVKISLANTTGANNTLTLILAALNALNTSTNGAVLSAFITGTASTQMAHDGTNTIAATAAGGTASHGLKSSTAGAAGFTIQPV